MAELPPIEIDPKTFLVQHCTLPALPVIITRVQEIMHSGNMSIKKVADLIRTDPSLVAQVLKIVNSAYYSLPKEIANVNLAVAYMGIHEVYRVILSIAVMKTLAGEDTKDFNQIWFHSFYTALCAKHLAEKCEPLLPLEELWTGAILHDIGKMVYLKFFPDHYKALQEYRNKHGCFFGEAEKHYGFPPSGYIGTLLCDHWRLPDKIKNACQFHTLNDLVNLKGTSSEDIFKRIICTANLMTSMITDSLSKEKKEETTEVIKSALNWSESDFMFIMGDIYELKIEAEKFL